MEAFCGWKMDSGEMDLIEPFPSCEQTGAADKTRKSRLYLAVDRLWLVFSQELNNSSITITHRVVEIRACK